MAASANRQSAIGNRQSALVRLGQLSFEDFLLLSAETLDFGHWTPDASKDWYLATNNAPRVALRFQFSTCNLQTADCKIAAVPGLADVHAAQQRLVERFAYALLRAKAPPLYDALPWHDWDFSVVTRRFPLWRTRFVLAGDGTTVAMCRCRKSAGVYVVEPDEAIARYVERKAAIEKVRRFRLVSLKPQASSFKLSEIPLPDNSVDLAIVGSIPALDTGNWKLATHELLRVAANTLLVENNPLCPPLDLSLLRDHGFVSQTVEVNGLGPRPCHLRSDR